MLPQYGDIVNNVVSGFWGVPEQQSSKDKSYCPDLPKVQYLRNVPEII